MAEVVFRAGVGAVIINGAGEILVFQRSDNDSVWQLPQGGLKTSEEPLQGVLREVREETGIEPGQLRLLREHPDWLAYEFPAEIRATKTYLGQAHKWFLFRFTGAENGIDLQAAEDDEFKAWQWMSGAELLEKTFSFKTPVYRKLLAEFSDHLSKTGEWWVYVIRCRDGSLYTGVTTDVSRRFKEHQAGGRKCARYLRGKAPLELAFHSPAGLKREALRVEKLLKKLAKREKEALVLGKFSLADLRGNS